MRSFPDRKKGPAATAGPKAANLPPRDGYLRGNDFQGSSRRGGPITSERARTWRIEIVSPDHRMKAILTLSACGEMPYELSQIRKPSTRTTRSTCATMASGPSAELRQKP